MLLWIARHVFCETPIVRRRSETSTDLGPWRVPWPAWLPRPRSGSRPAYIAATRSIRTTDGVTCPIRTGFRPHQFFVRMNAVTGTTAKWGTAARPTWKRRLSAKPPRRRVDPRFHQINGLATFCNELAIWSVTPPWGSLRIYTRAGYSRQSSLHDKCRFRALWRLGADWSP